MIATKNPFFGAPFIRFIWVPIGIVSVVLAVASLLAPESFRGAIAWAVPVTGILLAIFALPHIVGRATILAKVETQREIPSVTATPESSLIIVPISVGPRPEIRARADEVLRMLQSIETVNLSTRRFFHHLHVHHAEVIFLKSLPNELLMISLNDYPDVNKEIPIVYISGHYATKLEGLPGRRDFYTPSSDVCVKRSVAEDLGAGHDLIRPVAKDLGSWHELIRVMKRADEGLRFIVSCAAETEHPILRNSAMRCAHDLLQEWELDSEMGSVFKARAIGNDQLASDILALQDLARRWPENMIRIRHEGPFAEDSFARLVADYVFFRAARSSRTPEEWPRSRANEGLRIRVDEDVEPRP